MMVRPNIADRRAPSVDIDPFSVASLSDPYPDHARMRDAGPVVLIERYGFHAMARHEEVYASLNDWQTYSSARGVGIQDFAKEARIANANLGNIAQRQRFPAVHDHILGSRKQTVPSYSSCKPCFCPEATWQNLMDSKVR